MQRLALTSSFRVLCSSSHQPPSRASSHRPVLDLFPSLDAPHHAPSVPVLVLPPCPALLALFPVHSRLPRGPTPRGSRRRKWGATWPGVSTFFSRVRFFSAPRAIFFHSLFRPCAARFSRAPRPPIRSLKMLASLRSAAVRGVAARSAVRKKRRFPRGNPTTDSRGKKRFMQRDRTKEKERRTRGGGEKGERRRVLAHEERKKGMGKEGRVGGESFEKNQCEKRCDFSRGFRFFFTSIAWFLSVLSPSPR